MYRLSTGEAITDWCKANNKPYSTLWRYIALEGLTPEQAVEKHNKKFGERQKYKYWWKGVHLRRYCADKGYCYPYIVKQILERKCTLEEIMAKYEA